MTRTVGLLLVAILVGACASKNGDESFPVDCARTLCGCSTETSQSIRLRLADADGDPVANSRLVCHDSGEYLGTTNPNGILSLTVEGSSTPGCGFIPDCQVAYFRNADDSFGRHFWFARFVGGEDVSAKAQSVELMERND